MIPAPPGLVANYKGLVTPKPVIAFDEDGRAMVIGNGGLVHADDYNNFDGISDEDPAPVTALIPSGGWRVEFTSADGTKWSQPLVGWAVRAGGLVSPLSTDRDGYVEPLMDISGTWRVYHPDATPTDGSES